MNKKVMVSIIMPIYNAEKYLARAIDSILEQTYGDFELILVNDGSIDASEKICEEYKKKDDRINYFYKKNGGVCSARNYGLRFVNGKYLFFMDNDDEIDKDLLKDNIALLEKYNADAIKFEKKYVEINNDIVVNQFCSNGIEGLNVKQNKYRVIDAKNKRFLYRYYKANLMMNIWNGIYKAGLFFDNSITFYEDFKNGHEDILINMQLYPFIDKLILNNKVYYVHNYRLNGSTSSIYKPKRVDDSIYTVNYEKDLFLSYGYGKTTILEIYMDNLYISLLCMRGAGLIEEIRQIKKYRKNMLEILDNRWSLIFRLFKKNFTRAVLAVLLEIKAYILIILLFKMYLRKEQKKSNAI